MGSSVFHGGFSTFIAISVLSPSESYIFIVFFRLWFGIILFGLLNGFMLLPVILAYIGPTYSTDDPLFTNEGTETVDHPDSSKSNENDGNIQEISAIEERADDYELDMTN